MSDFFTAQQKLLRTMLVAQGSTSLYRHLDLTSLNARAEFDDVYHLFTLRTPIVGAGGYLSHLQHMTAEPLAEATELLVRPNLVQNGKPAGIALRRAQALPVGESFFGSSSNALAALVKTYKLGSFFSKPKLFMLAESVAVNRLQGIPHGTTDALLAARGFSNAVTLVPSYEQLQTKLASTPSRFQHLHTLAELLVEYGKQADILYTAPRVLAELSVLLAQRAGREVKLSEFCPSIKLVLFSTPTIAPYTLELTNFIGIDTPFADFWTEDSGLVAHQGDPNLRGWFSLDPTAAFYEFVPASDLESDGKILRTHRRLWAGEVEKDKEYLLITNHPGGLVGYNTGHIVRVVTTKPVHVTYRRISHKLNHFSEGLGEDQVRTLIEVVNKSLGGRSFLIRDFMVADDVAAKIPRWVLEVSRPLTDIPPRMLQSLADKLHTELELVSPAYHRAFKMGLTNKPEITFVPVGTFSNMPDSFEYTPFDFSPEANKVKAVLARAYQPVILTVQSGD